VGGSASLPESEVYAYTDGASTVSRGPGGYGVVISWKDKTEEISGGEQNTTNLRMEITAACVALERIDEGHKVTIYSDASYLVNCMRRGWYKKWRENRWLNYRKEPVANRDLWERLLEATQRHQEVRWRKVKGHSKTQGPHKIGNDQADKLAVAAKRRQRDRQHRRRDDEMAPATLPHSERFLISIAWGSEECHRPASDTTLIPPGTQYGATLSKAGKGNPSKYAAFATPSKPPQRLTDHSQ
jgi:ribonuclease HI